MEHAVFAVATQALLFVLLVVSATTDMLERKVYNWTTYPAIAFGLTLGYCAGDLRGLATNAAGLAVGAGALGIAALTRGVGFGDVKLLAAIGAVKGLPFVVFALFYSSLVGAALALGYLAYEGRVLSGITRSARASVGLALEPAPGQDAIRTRIPYGVAIAFGTLVAWALVEGAVA